MEEIIIVPYSVYQSQRTRLRKQKFEQKQEKDVIVPKKFHSVYNAVNSRLKTSKNKPEWFNFEFS